MPFDARGYEAHTLADHLAMIGITPVPMTVLTAHKAEQVRKHPESVLNKRWPYFLTGTLVGVGLMVWLATTKPPTTILEGLALLTIGLLIGLLSAAGSIIAVFLYCNAFRVKVLDKAMWLETAGWRYRQVPQPILEIIQRTDNSLSGTIIYGELIQNESVLDPYILVRTPTEEACLGIWEDDRIVAIAVMD